MHSLSIIAPCRNEEANIETLVARTLAVLDRLPIEGELVLVDDGSSDQTWGAIGRACQRDRRVRGIRHSCNLGITSAWRSGLAAASGDLACLIDADLQNRPEDVPRLYAAYVKNGADIVQAVRHPVGALHRHRWFTRGLNTLLNLAFGTKLRDNKSGFLLCRRDALLDVLRHRLRYRYFQAFIGVAAVSRGLVIAEVDTTFDRRYGGRSFLSRFPVITCARIVWELVKFRTETWMAGLVARDDPRTAMSAMEPRGPLADCL